MKTPSNGFHTSFFMYGANTRIRNIWSDISVTDDFWGDFCMSNIYQIWTKSHTELKLKHHVPYHINQIKIETY